MRVTQTASLLVLALVALAFAGCSSANYPTLPGVNGMGQTVLTPEEQQARIKTLANAQAAAGATVQPTVLTQPAPAQ